MKRPTNDAVLTLVRAGLTNDELCAQVGISTRTLTRWRVTDPDLSTAISTERARLAVERQQITRAHGTTNRYRHGCRCSLCTEANRVRCYREAMRRRAALGLPPPDGRRGRRPKHAVTLEPLSIPGRCTQIAQAIAAGQPASRIMASLGISYAQYREVRDQLDEAASA